MSKVDGYISISAEVVEKACQEYLADRKRRQDEKTEEYVKERLGRERHGFFGTGKPLTREEIIEGGWYTFDISIGGAYWASKAENALILAQVAIKQNVENILLSEEAVGVIADFIPKKEILHG